MAKDLVTLTLLHLTAAVVTQTYLRLRAIVRGTAIVLMMPTAIATTTASHGTSDLFFLLSTILELMVDIVMMPVMMVMVVRNFELVTIR